LGNPKYVSLVAVTRAGAVIVPEDFIAKERTVIKAKNPQLAFAKVLVMLDKERAVTLKAGVHASAVVSIKSQIGKDVHVGPFVVVENGVVVGDGSVIMANCYIGKDTRIGKNAMLYPGVTLRERVTIGNNAIIHSGAVIGSDGFGFIPQGNSNFKIPQIGSVEIGDDVEIGANVTIDRATTGATKIGKGTKLDNQVHIAHNIQIGENCLIAGQTGFAGSSKIGNNVMMAGQVGVNGHITIGNGVIVGGKAVVINDVPDNATISGYPARIHKENLKLQALVGKLPEFYADLKKLKGKFKKRGR
jgi:UDP-3-O-[3-hydroxymyristoyl] glucosamine N-acyltransferase